MATYGSTVNRLQVEAAKLREVQQRLQLTQQPQPGGKQSASTATDLIIEDDIDTELSMAGWGKGQHSKPPVKQKPPTGTSLDMEWRHRRGGNSTVMATDTSGRFANKIQNETQLDTVLFPPVRRRTTPGESSNPGVVGLNKLAPLPPVRSAEHLKALEHGGNPEEILEKSTEKLEGINANDTTSTNSSVSRKMFEPETPPPPSKLSLDRPWWKSVGREQQNQLLAAVQPPMPAPPTPTPPPIEPNQDPVFLETAKSGSISEQEIHLVGAQSGSKASGPRLWTREPITEKQIETLRLALFANGDSRFSPDWSSQGFYFGFELIPYLLTSSKLEPRTALNIVQGELIRQLLFVRASSGPPAAPADPAHRLRMPSKAGRTAALARAFTAIVARCGSPIKIALPSPNSVSHIHSFGYIKDGISETLEIYTCQEGCDVAQFLAENSRCFESQRNPSLVLLLYSCLLTLGVDGPDFIPPKGSPWPLIGPDNLANQSLLSLMLCGTPVGLVCNHGDEETAAAGIPSRCDIGMLSQREFATRRSSEPFKLGSFLKAPRCPVWLLELGPGRGRSCIAFATDAKLVSDWRAERLFELQLTSPELRGRCPGRALVDCRGKLDGTSASDEDSETESETDEAVAAAGETASGKDTALDGPAAEIHPVEMCIRSKWPGAEVQLIQLGIN